MVLATTTQPVGEVSPHDASSLFDPTNAAVPSPSVSPTMIQPGDSNTTSKGQQQDCFVVSSPVTVVAAKPHHPMTLPPTKRDDRKLFVGGLPPDGT
jgi:hypothetical protein